MVIPKISRSRRANINFTTLNTKGLNHQVKRKKVFTHLAKMRTDIAFLTETLLLNKDHARLNRGGFSQIFHSRLNAKCRGTAILIHRDVQFVKSKLISEADGRFIIVQGQLFDLPVILACVYAPNWDNAKIFSNFFSLLPELNSHQLILGRDLICILNPTVDRSRGTPGILSKSAETINAFLQAYGVIDAWRYRNLVARQYSFLQHTSHTPG